MRLQKIDVLVAVIGCALLSVSLFGFTPEGQATTTLEYGPVVNGLQLSISLDKPSKDGSLNLLVTLQNVGEKDVLVNLGAIVGQFQSPNAFYLSIKDDVGNMKEYHFVDNRYSGIAGRIDNYVLPLRNGASYSLKLPLKQFWPSKLNLEEFPFKKLNHGTYQVYASFDGSDYKYFNSGDKDNPIISPIWNGFIWKGKLQSNTISFEQ
jgi:hypothetical protein